MHLHYSVVVFSCMFTSLLPASFAGNTSFGWGAVNMQGAIIETACAIAVESQSQSIDMEVTSIADISRDGKGRVKPFAIELINCVIERQDKSKTGWKNFQITFDGDAEGNFFSVTGEASGIALKITDQSGKMALPGRPLAHEDLTSENMKLNYNLHLVANQSVLRAGEFFSAIRFKLDYF
ncbi:fimbrial protein [Enterobacter cloacae]|uniref:fimbrial protein n=1 Tax=Enterobacter cloacae TaxID=550 RepID=UPI00214C6561|nr:fimbrial protein [Enterobacter cloacae]